MTKQPAFPKSVLTSSTTQLEAAIARLNAHKDAWVKVSIPERIDYLQRCMKGVMAIAAEWAEVACHAKGIDPKASLAGEEWLVGPVATLLNLQRLINTLKAKGQPKPEKIFTRPDGQVIAQVFPDNLMDRLLWLGFSSEVWMQPGQPATQGMVYRQPSDSGKLALILGAGNIAAIAPMDTLYKLFAEDQVVLLKMNPVNEYVGAFLEQAFHSLIEAGFLAVVYGGAEVGQYLCQHSAIETIHITGAHQTHDAIVWGSTAQEQQRRKAANDPILTKPITSELGCVTPILVVPGQWSPSTLAFQARQVASVVAHNASFNCAAGKVLVMAKGWAQREEFLEQVHQVLAKTAPRKAYYPGAQQRYQGFLDHYPQAIALGARTETVVPWTIIPDVPPHLGEYALQTEAFCGVLAEVTLEAEDTAAFLTSATEFANEAVWGNLSCVVLIDSKTQKRYRSELEQAIAQLRFGNIGINAWTGMTFTLPAATWGAFPENSLQDIRSGLGVVHNAYLFEHPQKTVLRAPFRTLTTPIWFADHKNLLQVARRYAALLMAPSWGNFFSVVLAALRG